MLTDVTEGLNINNYVENGGGVLLIGEGVKNLAELNFTTRQVPSLNKYLIIDWVDYLSPIFEPFKLQGSGNLSYAKFYKIISSESTKLPSDIKILAKFNDDTPALCEKDMGKGKLIFLQVDLP